MRLKHTFVMKCPLLIKVAVIENIQIEMEEG